MKVRELKALLASCDDDAEVTTMFQPEYPFEARLDGLAIRESFQDGSPFGRHELTYNEVKEGNDVILLVGEQLSYGSKWAWDYNEFWG